MFIIRREQLNAFDAVAERDFHLRLMHFLREELPEQTAELDEEQLLKYIKEATQCAGRHGIESDLGIAQYACLALATVPTLADTPRIAAFLRTPGTDPEEQLDALIEFMDSQLYIEDD
ncbi:hypothetical protein JQX13_21255 [Archangium violaceum]|uniref:hypothetical protein n=1 Tax=Archangium violaceum TaxID=83451 RepID=UPI00193BD862|nr:hypothetical protein [Archangium violaceum]QRK12328.1 hypothetical protein JQX13_21255 [Archangium violaceum]